jgi:hypothetical protein
MKQTNSNFSASRAVALTARITMAAAMVLCFVVGPYIFIGSDRSSIGSSGFIPDLIPRAGATSAYADLSLANLSFSITPSTTNQISSNDNWSGVPSVEGYFGQGLTGTHGVDPQTVLGTEFAGNALPVVGSTQVNANKGNPSAYNAGGVTEFDVGTYITIAMQGNVQANPYIVFYVNTLNRSNISISYEVTDIDGGNNNCVSPLALQYRVGGSGLFTNVPAAFIPDATDGPNLVGRVTTRSVLLPAAVSNQAQVQIRLITTNGASSSGSSTPDEWIGINNVVISSLGPSAAHASIAGRVTSSSGRSVARAIITMTDRNGRVQTAITNPFGYFSFNEALAGATYIFEIRSKEYSFEPRVVVVVDDLVSLDFVALE